jgi:hypothetical protein
MIPMSPEQIAQWMRDNPKTRFECTTFKARTPNGKVFNHADSLPGVGVVGIALSTQGRMGETQLGNFVDSISESLETSSGV